MNSKRLALVLAVVASSFAPVVPGPRATAATTITVTTFTDELNAGGACSLREALRSANTNAAVGGCPAGAPGEDIIVLGAGTYILSIGPSGDDAALSGDLDFTDDAMLHGAGPGATTIDAAAGWTDRILQVHPNVSVLVSGVTITGGNILTSNGGGIFNWGELTLVNSAVSQNYSASFGGGIASQGPLVLIDSSVAGNIANVGDGGISQSGHTLTVLSSQISSNSTNGEGGGIGTSADSTLIVNSWIIGNQAASHGGGIRASGPVNIRNSTMQTNTAGGHGGAIYGFGSPVIENSTISGNNAFESGGGLYANGGTWELYNVTIANNQADADMGGNTGNGGGVYINSGTMNMRNSILALNQDLGAGTYNPDCSGTLTSLGYNLIQSGVGCIIVGNTTGNLLAVNPQLGPLQNNGGPTLTHALLISPASPAINAGDPAGCLGQFANLLPSDQRYGARSGRCDMGAYEQNACMLIGDVDDDRDVDVDDIVAAALVWDTAVANYSAAADVDWNGFNTLIDIQLAAAQFGQTCP